MNPVNLNWSELMRTFNPNESGQSEKESGQSELIRINPNESGQSESIPSIQIFNP